MNTSLSNKPNAMWFTLFGMIACLAMIFLDQTAIPVALPSIQSSILISALQTRWVLNAYLLAIAVLIIPMGKLADRYGHKMFFISGIAVFFIASVLCATANNGAALIVARVLQGIGAAIMMPASASIITDIVPLEERGKMMGIYIAVASIFLAIGPFIGGVFTQFFGWRSVFWLNLPFLLASFYLVNTATRANTLSASQSDKIDWFGLAWLSLSITPFVFALLQSETLNWHSPVLLGLIAVASVSLLFLVRTEKRRHNPVLDLSMLSNTSVKVGIAIVVLTQYAIISIAFWPSFLQNALHFSPGLAGLALLPVTLPIMFISPVAGNLMDQKGPRQPVAMGAFCLTVGSLWIGISAWSQSYLLMLPGFLIFGCGPSFILACMMGYLFSVVDPRKRGSIAGFTTFFRQVGSAIGLALTTSILSNSAKYMAQTGYASHHIEVMSFTYSTVAIAFFSLIMMSLLKYLPNQALSHSPGPQREEGETHAA